MKYYIITKKTFGILTLLLFFFNITIAQVGINTTTPNANSELDINGRVVIQDLSRTAESLTGVRMVLIEADGTLIEATLPSSLISKDDTTHEITMTETSSSTVDKIVLLEENFQDKNNWDIDLDGDNSDVTVFIIRKDSGGDKLRIRGINGGTEGRKIRIINDSGEKIQFIEDFDNANSGNKIYIYTSKNEMTSYGSCELIYSKDISDDGGHWNIVQLDEN